MGISYRELSDDKPPSALRGTGFFMAPEVAWTPPDSTLSSDTLSTTLDAQISAIRPAITKAVDVWSLAVTLYCFLFGKFPFQTSSDGNDSHYHTRYMLFREICTADWTVPNKMGADGVPVPLGGRFSKDHNDVIFLLDCMLRKDPSLRISIDGVKCYPWVLQDIANPRQWLDSTTPPFSKPSPHWTRRVGHMILDLPLSLWSSCK
jgi:[calcium/calmodulin-dependent protein kinase] kinase